MMHQKQNDPNRAGFRSNENVDHAGGRLISPEYSTNPPSKSMTRQQLIERFTGLGFDLLVLNGKRPEGNEWQDHTITDPRKFPAGKNIGLFHKTSGTCALDLDHDMAGVALAAVEVNLGEILTAANFKITGDPANPPKPIYLLPNGLNVTTKKLTWDHPTDKLPNGQPTQVTIFELRGGDGNFQDVLPGSIHPTTRKPYTCDNIPVTRADMQQLPQSLALLWANWDALLPKLKAACPWRSPETAKPARVASPQNENPDVAIVQNTFNERYNPGEILERNGYKKRGDKWLVPGSSSGIPGVVLLDNDKVYSHHGSDVLGDGKPHDAYDLAVILEYSGDKKRAWREIRKELGVLNNAADRKSEQFQSSDVGNLNGATMHKQPTQETNTRQYRSDDTGNSERFTDQHGDMVRYVHTWGKWLIWNGTHWRIDETGEIERLAKHTARSIWDEVGALGAAGHAEQAEKLAKWAAQSGNASRRAAMLALARSELPIAITHEELNTHPLLLNCANGTLNLATGELLPHDPTHLITKCLSIPYETAAPCPLWVKFLARIFDNDQGMIGLMQKIFGLSLSGVTIQKLFFWFGLGANGKSTAGETLLSLLGDYAAKTPAETLLMRDKSNIPNDIAALAGARVVIASELPEGRRLNESMVKDMTGGDRITARFLNKEFFTLTPEFKLVMYGNHKPVISGTDNGIWRRVILMPFNVQIPESEQDPELTAKLRAEMTGILAWAVKGWQMYQAEGLTPPAAAKQATESYRAESDLLGQFLADCTIQRPGAEVASSELHDAYISYTGHSISAVRFSRLMVERGFSKAQGTSGHTKGKILWLGIGRKTDDDTQDIPGFDITQEDFADLAKELGGRVEGCSRVW